MSDISFIVCGRNDNYGGNFIQRINNFINSIAILSSDHNIKSEIIIVEWNPVQDKKFLWQEIQESNNLIKKFNQLIKFIIVPQEYHKKYKNNDKHHLPVLDYLGKNVGIRRSTGEFILVCSPDIIFQEDFFIKLKTKFFQDKYIYRTFRADYTPVLDTYSTLDGYKQFLNKCKQQTFIIHTNDGIDINQTGDRVNTKVKFDNGCGDFLLASRNVWQSIRGCPEITDVFSHLDSLSLKKLQTVSEQWVLPLSCAIYHQDHDRPHILTDNYHAVNLGDYHNPENWGISDADFEIINL